MLPSESTITICHTVRSVAGIIRFSNLSNRQEKFLLIVSPWINHFSH